jgi:UDP-N-acetylglucosamine acyltransferase
VIHASAIVSPDAQIDSSAKIGPYAVIGPHVVIEKDVHVGSHCVIEGWTTLAEAVRVWPHAILGGDPQDWSFDPTWRSFLRIGARTKVRELVTVSRGSREDATTTIGEDCMLMNSAHVAHDCTVGNRVTIAGGALVAGHVTIEDGAFLSGNVVVHQFSRIGRLVMVGGNRRVPRDVPPFVLVNSDDSINGVNLVGMRRNGIEGPARKEIVRMVSILRDSAAPITELIETFAPQTDEGREFVNALRAPGDRGYMAFSR